MVLLRPLPDTISLNDFKGEYDSYVNALYSFFKDNIDCKMEFMGIPIKCRYHESINNMHGSFWHLITESIEESKKDSDRLLETRRAERLAWIPHIIKNHMNSDIDCWENKRGSNRNIVLWFKDEKYMIILSRRKGFLLLVSAYKHRNKITKRNEKESNKYLDPRKS